MEDIIIEKKPRDPKKKAGVGIRSVLSVIMVSMSYLILLIMIYHPVPDQNKDLVNIAIGVILGGGIGAVSGYYFSDSHTKPKE